jgi:hypothetical protein
MPPLAPLLLEFSSHQLESAATLLQVGRFVVIFIAARAIAELMCGCSCPPSSGSWWPAC